MDTSLWLIGVHLKVVFRVLVFLGNFYLLFFFFFLLQCHRSQSVYSRGTFLSKNKGLEGVQ